ncbi:hypothetical protein L1F28_29480 [Arthrospira platensis NCB002]|uniref:hypothetical protein n=1 Tax=Limnospira platensis TaxID=118562 RepID=UPI002971030D|nr:hypothetical protein [Arthrospira platensis NCB002]
MSAYRVLSPPQTPLTQSRYLLVMECDRFLVDTQNFLNSQTKVDICGYGVRSLLGKSSSFPIDKLPILT